MHYFLLIVIGITNLNLSNASTGDTSPHYRKCLNTCTKMNCSDENNKNFIESIQQPVHLYLLRWTCLDECKYECTWKAVDTFHRNGWKTPQFHGKWPFIRFFGIQEPASVLFSVLNFYFHWKMIKKFREQVRPDSPMYWMWHVCASVCLHGWIWSSVFHTRDTDFTELLDYVGAFSMVLMSCYLMCYRILHDKVYQSVMVVITTFFMAFFISHVMYLREGSFNYRYNMLLNIFLGIFTSLCWWLWCSWNYTRQRYVWKCTAFVALTGLVTLLEVIDIPPVFYVIDSHALWHLCTAPLVCLYYGFAIDDCNYLRKQKFEQGSKNL